MQIGKDFIGVSAGVVLINPKGKFFLAKRGRYARDDQGKWEFSGGSISLFESREEAAKRNISEKYDIHIENLQLLNVYDIIDPNEQDHWVLTTYISRNIQQNGEIVFPEKCDEIGWFTLEEMQQLELSRITKLNLQDILHGYLTSLSPTIYVK